MDMMKKLRPPATKRKELLTYINTKVNECNGLSAIRISNCKAYADADLEEVRSYLSTRRMVLFNQSAVIQRYFDKQFVKLM